MASLKLQRLNVSTPLVDMSNRGVPFKGFKKAYDANTKATEDQFATQELFNTDLTAVQTNLTDAQNDLITAFADISDAQADILVQQGLLTAQQADLTTAQGQLTTQQAALTTAQGNITTLQGQQATAISNITTLQGQQATSISNINALQSWQTTAISNITTLQGQQATAISDINALQSWQTAAILAIAAAQSDADDAIDLANDAIADVATFAAASIGSSGLLFGGSPSGGYLAISHSYTNPGGYPVDQKYCTAQAYGAQGFFVSVISVDASTLTVHLADHTGASITGGSYSILWRVAGA